MEIKQLRIRNFMSLGSADLGLDSRGLVLIQGSNLDDTSAKSNGAGKSSIPDAISWCLYGETARGESGDAIVNREEGANTEVEITLVDGDDEFVVGRYRKHKDYKNRLTLSKTVRNASGSYDSVGMTDGTDKLTQIKIDRLLGCPLDVFTSAIYAGQERMPDLPAMTDKQLKELIEQAAGITELQGYHETAKELNHGHATLLKVGAVAVEKMKLGLTRINASLEEKVDWEKEWNSARLVKMKALLDQHARLSEWATDDEFLLRIHCKQAELDEAETELKAAKSLLLSVDTIGPALEKVVSDRSRTLTVMETNLKASGRAVNAAKVGLESLDASVGTPCKECGKPYCVDDLATAREARTAGLRDIVTTYRGAQKDVAEARSVAEDAQAELVAHRASIVPDATKAEEFSQLTAEAATIRAAFWDAKNEHKEFSDRRAAITAAHSEENPYEKVVSSLKGELTEAQVELGKAEEYQVKLTTIEALSKAAVEVFSPAGVRAHILDHVTPYLNTRTAHYLSVLSDGNLTAMWSTLSSTAKGELREKFVIEVNNAKGGGSFGLLSGGEKRKVRLACSLALQDLVANRASKPFRLFVADEIDDALDASGMERLMTLLDEKARERGTVLVISHNSLSDWIREVVTVKKQDGKSTVEGSICLA